MPTNNVYGFLLLKYFAVFRVFTHHKCQNGLNVKTQGIFWPKSQYPLPGYKIQERNMSENGLAIINLPWRLLWMLGVGVLLLLLLADKIKKVTYDWHFAYEAATLQPPPPQPIYHLWWSKASNEDDYPDMEWLMIFQWNLHFSSPSNDLQKKLRAFDLRSREKPKSRVFGACCMLSVVCCLLPVASCLCRWWICQVCGSRVATFAAGREDFRQAMITQNHSHISESTANSQSQAMSASPSSCEYRRRLIATTAHRQSHLTKHLQFFHSCGKI